MFTPNKGLLNFITVIRNVLIQLIVKPHLHNYCHRLSQGIKFRKLDPKTLARIGQHGHNTYGRLYLSIL